MFRSVVQVLGENFLFRKFRTLPKILYTTIKFVHQMNRCAYNVRLFGRTLGVNETFVWASTQPACILAEGQKTQGILDRGNVRRNKLTA